MSFLLSRVTRRVVTPTRHAATPPARQGHRPGPVAFVLVTGSLALATPRKCDKDMPVCRARSLRCGRPASTLAASSRRAVSCLLVGVTGTGRPERTLCTRRILARRRIRRHRGMISDRSSSRVTVGQDRISLASSLWILSAAFPIAQTWPRKFSKVSPSARRAAGARGPLAPAPARTALR